MREGYDKQIIEALEAKGLIVVQKKWYDLAIRALGGEFGCPFCGSKREAPYTKDDPAEIALPRRGCLDCGEWWDPVVLKDRG